MGHLEVVAAAGKDSHPDCHMLQPEEVAQEVEAVAHIRAAAAPARRTRVVGQTAAPADTAPGVVACSAAGAAGSTRGRLLQTHVGPL